MSETWHNIPDEAITDRPWRGNCATTGLTMDEFRERLDHVLTEQPTMPYAVTRAAVSIIRSYGRSIRGICDVGYITNVIAGEMCRANLITCPGDQHDRHGKSHITADHGRCEVCDAPITDVEDSRLNADTDFVDHWGDSPNRHTIRRVRPTVAS